MSRAVSFFIAILFLAAPGSLPVQAAQPLTIADGITPLLNKIEMQRYNWLGYKAEIKMRFTTRQGQTAACRGELTYYRLEERLLLQCYNSNKNTLFIFKTNDLDFDLFLPMQKTLYKGNIFDLEFSDNIDSHIKPYDLYRGLKPMLIPFDKVKLESQDKVLTTFLVMDNRHGKNFWGRRAQAETAKGDVLAETYFDPAGQTELLIRRSDFKKVSGRGKISRDPLRFPFRVRLQNYKDNTETEILFLNLEVIKNPPEGDWRIVLPQGTQTMVFPKVDFNSQ